VDRRLEPGQGLTVALALGLAETSERTPGRTPRVPDISDEDWSVWRSFLPEDDRPASDQVEFAAEWVELDIEEHELAVNATYWVRNRGGASSLGIRYPILTSAGRPAPARVEVNGRSLPVRPGAPDRVETHFSVAVPDRGLASFRVRYRQPLRERRAVYLVTSALSWPSPIGRAVFVIRHPTALGKVQLSYAPRHSESSGGRTTHWVIRQPFVPDREVEARW
jgi:hypothetical protein